MKIRAGQEERYASWKAKNDDRNEESGGYGWTCFLFAEDWANTIESAMAAGSKLEDVAKRLSFEASERHGGITGFMYGIAVDILSKCWEHGEHLRRWSNLDLQIRDEGENANAAPGAVLNPALLNLGPAGPEAGTAEVGT